MSDYEFKNTALAKLYKKFMNNGPWLTVKPVDGMLEAFIECDEKLADIQDQCDHWKTMYGNACGDQDVLKESIRLLDTENRDLKKRCEDLRKHNVDVITVNNKTIDQLRKDNEEMKHVIDDFVAKVSDKDDDIEKLDHMLQDLQREYDKLKNDRDRKAEAVVELAKKRDALQEEYYKLLNNSGYLRNSRDTWRSRAKHAEKEVEDLNKRNEAQRHVIDDFVTKVDELIKDRDRKAEAVVKLEEKRDRLQEALDNIRAELEEKVKRMDKITKDCDLYSELYYELSKDFDELCEEIKKLLDEHEELKKRLMETTDILEKTNRDRNEWKRRALMTKLTSKVPDIKEEYEITFTMDKADYKDLMNLLSSKAFGASPNYMRDFLKRFCDDHDSCRVCPLKECGSDLGSSFDSMSDEEIEKYYKIAISSK